MTKRSYLPKQIRLSAGPLVVLSSLVVSCAEERPVIDQVQPNALDKSFFVGELDNPTDDPVFFTRQFVVDSTESESLIGISGASGLERIRWEITEDMLFGRRAYAVTDGETRGTGELTDGAIVAAYKIESHFDIRKAYNPATGEELNVDTENTTDRPWNERRQMRVDWSENLVDSPVWTTMFFGKTFGRINVTSVAYDVSDPSSSDAPHFVPEDGYFDITSHFLVEPEMTDFGYFELPTCFLIGILTGSAIYTCDPQEAVVRSSYWRVSEADPDDDFEPFENTQAQLDIFGNPGGIGDSASVGIVTAPHEQFDPGYGYTDQGLSRFMNRHNLWKQNHQTGKSCEADSDCGEGECLDSGVCTIPCNYEARGDRDANGTDDQCENDDTKYEGSEGAQCSARNRCTLPYRDRELRPVAYTVNPEMPSELQDSLKGDGSRDAQGPSEDLIETWNQALQLAVAHAREVECRRTSSNPESDGTRAECHAEFFEQKSGQDVIQMVSYGGWGIATPKDDGPALVLCHNPVRSYDAGICGQEGETFRVGDLRRHFLIYWPNNTRSPYGGIGNWRGDPVTGHIVGAAATTIGRSTTISAARVRDIAMVALGEQDLDDVLVGVSASLYQKRLREGHNKKPLSAAEIQRRLDAVDFEHLGQTVDFDLSALPNGQVGDDAHAALNAMQQTRGTDIGLAMQDQQRFEAAASNLVGSRFEADLVDSSWLVDAVGFAPNSQINDAMMEQASPLRGQELGLLSLADRNVMRALGARGVCHLEPHAAIGAPEVAVMGSYYKKKYPNLSGSELAEAMYQDLWRETYKGIQLHEIGHSLGLLHNFTSSYDALNFNPQYWQLRSQEGQGLASCEGNPREGNTSSTANDTCMGPRYLDPETDDELGRGSEPRPGIAYFGHTSTMEYQTARFFESVGLGQYDVMAMGALYGGVLETFDARQFSTGAQVAFEPLHRSQLSEDIYIATTTGGLTGRHYTELARDTELYDAGRCRDASKAEIAKAEWRVVHGKICTPPPKDYGHWDDFVDVSDPGTPRTSTARKLRIPQTASRPAAGSVRWPYRFGGDQMNGYLHVNPFDSGADVWEVTQNAIERNDYEYPFTYFRRHRRDWTTRGLPSYTARLFYERLRSYHWGVSFTNAFFQELVDAAPRFAGQIDDLRNDDNELRPALLAQTDMLQALMNTYLSPEPGQYGQLEVDGAYNLTDFTTNTSALFELDASQAKFIAPAYDSGPSAGGSWDYHSFVERAGFQVEKAIAARALTDGRPVFYSVSRDNYLDSRRVYINFRSGMPQAVDRLLGGILSEDWGTVSPFIEGTNSPNVRARDLTSSVLESALPGGTRAVFPNVGYNQQVPAVIWALLFGRINGDLTLSNKLRIWLDGSLSGELDVPEAEQVRFSDPDSGITYIARLFGPEELYGKTVDTGIGSRMLTRANELLVAAFEVERDDDGEIVRDEFGRPELQRTEAGSAMPSDDRVAYAKFRNYVGTIDAAVQINTLVGFGPFNFF